MKKHRMSKAKNQTYHFKKRCDERLGVQIDRKAIQRRIRAQKFDENFYLLNKQSNRVSRYRYKFQDKWYIIPYDKNTHKVITIFEDKKQDIHLIQNFENETKMNKVSLGENNVKIEDRTEVDFDSAFKSGFEVVSNSPSRPEISVKCSEYSSLNWLKKVILFIKKVGTSLQNMFH